MKKLGLIGGVGVESTIPYYKGITYGVQKFVQKPFFPNLSIESLSTFEVIRITQKGDLKELEEYFFKGFESLIASGAKIGAMACNTGHLVFEALQKRLSIPLISIVEATLKEVQRAKFSKVSLMGMKATMQGELYRKALKDSGVEVVLPNLDEQEYIHHIIANELEFGITKQESLEGFLKTIDRLQKETQIEAMILACTELPLLFKDSKAAVPLLDTMNLHIEAIIKAICEE